MSLENFLQSPWKRENTHPIYKDSVLAMNPAPEYANSEVLLASLYRVIGFSSISEGNVPQNGRDLDKKIQNLAQIQQLETLRDTLLPKLMSGTVKVNSLVTA